MADGDFLHGLEDMLPVAIRNVLKSYRYWDNGAQDRSDIYIKYEVGTAGVLGQMLGFSPSEAPLAFEESSALS